MKIIGWICLIIFELFLVYCFVNVSSYLQNLYFDYKNTNDKENIQQYNYVVLTKNNYNLHNELKNPENTYVLHKIWQELNHFNELGNEYMRMELLNKE